LYRLYRNEKLVKYLEEGNLLIEETLERSKKLDDIKLIIETHYWYIHFEDSKGFQKNNRKIIEIFQELQLVFDKISEEQSETKNYLETLLTQVGLVNYYAGVALNNSNPNFQSIIDRLEKAVSLFAKAKNQDDPLYLDVVMHLQLWLGHFYRVISELDKAISEYNKGMDIAEKFGNKYLMSSFQQSLANIYLAKGEENQYLELMEKSKKILIDLKNDRGLSSVYAGLGGFYYITGEMKKFLEYSLKAYNIRSENGTTNNTEYLDNVSMAYIEMGELDKALETSQKCYRLRLEDGKWGWGIHSAQENLGYVYYLRGDLDEAIKLQEDSAKFFEKSNALKWRWSLANNQRMLHLTYKKKGLINKTIQALEKALSLYKDTDDLYQAANILFYLVSVTSEQDMKDEAHRYNDQLKELINRLDAPKIKRLLLLTEGLMLKNSSEDRDRVKAEVIFDQLMQEDLGFQLEIEVLFNQCDLLIAELKRTESENVLHKLQEYLDKLVEISTKKNLVGLKIEGLWFKAQLLHLEDKVEDAKEVLNEALALAEEKGYNQLVLKISSSKDEITKRIIELEDGEEVPLSIEEKMKLLKIENGFEKVKQAKVLDISDLRLKQQV
jgi:tetratricopeptide (TPR) repeat protein